MSTIERDVSEGYPTDGRLFEPPQRNLDNERPRYLSFIGSLIDPETAATRQWTKGGGIEIANPSLRYVKNFLRKGRITPLLKDTHDYIPYDLARKYVGGNPFEAGYFPQAIPQGYVPPALPPAAGEFQPGFGSIAVGGPSPYGSLVGRIALPGEQIHAILNGPEALTHTNIRRGVVEHKSLLSHEYRPVEIDGAYVDPDIWRMQRAIFPSYPVLPVLLDDIEKLLIAAEVHTILRPIVDEMQESLIEFRDYASATIQNVHFNMRESGQKTNYIYRYTSIDLVLLEQLGLSRQDREIRSAATVQPNTKLEGMFEQWLAIQIEEKQANLDRMQRVAEPTVDATTMQVTPDLEGFGGASGYSGFSGQITAETEHTLVASGPTEPEATTEFKCECGSSFSTQSGLNMHRNRWCELKAKE